MPYSKDLRCGQGWFEVNLNFFYDYLDSRDEELIVRCDFDLDLNTTHDYGQQIKYHDDCLNEEIEERVNEFLSWKVFQETRKQLDEEDLLPESCDSVWDYVYAHVCRLVKRKPEWYLLRKIPIDGDGFVVCSSCGTGGGMCDGECE